MGNNYLGNYIDAGKVFIKEAKGKKYPEDVGKLAIMMCGTKVACRTTGSYENALRIATELCKKIDDVDEFLTQLGKKIGVDYR